MRWPAGTCGALPTCQPLNTWFSLVITFQTGWAACCAGQRARLPGKAPGRAARAPGRSPTGCSLGGASPAIWKGACLGLRGPLPCPLTRPICLGPGARPGAGTQRGHPWLQLPGVVLLGGGHGICRVSGWGWGPVSSGSEVGREGKEGGGPRALPRPHPLPGALSGPLCPTAGAAVLSWRLALPVRAWQLPGAGLRAGRAGAGRREWPLHPL